MKMSRYLIKCEFPFPERIKYVGSQESDRKYKAGGIDILIRYKLNNQWKAIILKTRFLLKIRLNS